MRDNCRYEVFPGRTLSWGMALRTVECPNLREQNSFFCWEHRMLVNLGTFQDISRFVDHSAMKLGRSRLRIDSRTLRVENYFAKTLAPAPVEVNWTAGLTSFGMMGNDHVGDCTFAAGGHAVQTWTANSGPSEVTIPDAQILSGYSALTGYTPSNPNSDQGANELDVLNYFRQAGIGGHEILGYGALEVANLESAKQAVDLLGGTYIGLALPLSAQSQNVWDVVSSVKRSLWSRIFSGKQSSNTDPGSWGGHAVWVPWYNAIGPVCVTWGALKQMTWAFWQKYCEEAYALASSDWITAKISSLVGVNLDNWQADVTALAA